MYSLYVGKFLWFLQIKSIIAIYQKHWLSSLKLAKVIFSKKTFTVNLQSSGKFSNTNIRMVVCCFTINIYTHRHYKTFTYTACWAQLWSVSVYSIQSQSLYLHLCRHRCHWSSGIHLEHSYLCLVLRERSRYVCMLWPLCVYSCVICVWLCHVVCDHVM